MDNKVAKWIDRYYKPERLNREPGSRERIIADRVKDLQETGWTIISKHESVTGKIERMDA